MNPELKFSGVAHSWEGNLCRLPRGITVRRYEHKVLGESYEVHGPGGIGAGCLSAVSLVAMLSVHLGEP